MGILLYNFSKLDQADQNDHSVDFTSSDNAV